MATFTMTLGDAILYEKGDIGLDDYPIFDPDYREHLNKKIIDHYINQEIGLETVSLFRHALKRRMNEIMPLYNQHYILSRLEIDPLSTVSIKTMGLTMGESKSSLASETLVDTENETNTDNASRNSSTSGAKSRTVASETPQTMLSENGDYATGMQDSISDSTAGGEATESGKTEGKQSGKTSGNETRGDQNSQDTQSATTGYNGHAPALIFAARQALVNVDMLVIEELRDLFMLVWSNHDSYTQNRIGYGYAY